MNESMLLRSLFLSLIAPALALAGCSAAPSTPPPLQGATMGGAFALTDQNGRRVTDADFAGKYRLVYFGFTSCPDVCPVDMQVIGAGLRQFEAEDAERAAQVQPIFISVDPARDTPQVLRAFVAHFHPRMVGLTGSDAEVADAARRYRIFYERGQPGTGGGYNVDHTRIIVLYGPAGEPIAIIPHDQGPAGVAGELERWVR